MLVEVNRLKQQKLRAFRSRSDLGRAPGKGSGFFELVLDAREAQQSTLRPAELPPARCWPLHEPRRGRLQDSNITLTRQAARAPRPDLCRLALLCPFLGCPALLLSQLAQGTSGQARLVLAMAKQVDVFFLHSA